MTVTERASLVVGVGPTVSDVTMTDSVGKLGDAARPAAGTRAGAEAAHQVLVREPEHGGQVAADVCDREHSRSHLKLQVSSHLDASLR